MENVVVFKTPERAIREHALLKYGELPPPHKEPDKNIPRKRRKERARELTRQLERQLNGGSDCTSVNRPIRRFCSRLIPYCDISDHQ